VGSSQWSARHACAQHSAGQHDETRSITPATRNHGHPVDKRGAAGGTPALLSCRHTVECASRRPSIDKHDAAGGTSAAHAVGHRTECPVQQQRVEVGHLSYLHSSAPDRHAHSTEAGDQCNGVGKGPHEPSSDIAGKRQGTEHNGGVVKVLCTEHVGEVRSSSCAEGRESMSTGLAVGVSGQKRSLRRLGAEQATRSSTSEEGEISSGEQSPHPPWEGGCAAAPWLGAQDVDDRQRSERSDTALDTRIREQGGLGAGSDRGGSGPAYLNATAANAEQPSWQGGRAHVPGKGPNFVSVFGRPELCAGDRLRSLDCEMCKTHAGLEVTRVSVVDQAGQVCSTSSLL
jgi:hypothetical protein